MVTKELTQAEKWQRRAWAVALGRVQRATAQDEFWRWRRNVAVAAEHGGRLHAEAVLGGLEEGWLRGLAAAHLSPELLQALDAYRRRTYPSAPDFGIGCWRGVLVGRRVVFVWRRAGERQTRYGTLPVVVEGRAFPPDGWRAPVHGGVPAGTRDGRQRVTAGRPEPVVGVFATHYVAFLGIRGRESGKKSRENCNLALSRVVTPGMIGDSGGRGR